MLSEQISELFERIGHTWLTDSGYIVPSAEDVQRVLDKAAVKMYDESIGDRLEVAGLIVEKTEYGNRVYCYIGDYQ